MKILIISLIIGFLSNICVARPTLGIIADIIDDFVHPSIEPYHHKPPPQYAHNGPYTQNGYHQPGYTQVGGTYGYHHQRPQHQTGGYSHNNGYYPTHQNGYYPPNGAYGPNTVYDNQGYYKGPPYPASSSNVYNYNNGYTNPGTHHHHGGYKSRGY